MPGSTAQTNKFHTFYLQQRPDNGDTWADIKVNHPLDYESIKEYNLTIRVEVSGMFHFHFLSIENLSTAKPTVWLADYDDNIYSQQLDRETEPTFETLNWKLLS